MARRDDPSATVKTPGPINLPCLAACLFLLAHGACVAPIVTYRVQDAPSGYCGELWRIDTVEDIRDASFSPNGRFLVWVESHTARICDVDSGRQIAQFSGHGDLFWHFRHVLCLPPYAQFFWLNMGVHPKADYIRRAAFAPDSEHVASAGADGTVRIWETRSGRQTAVLGPFDGRDFEAVAWSRDGGLIAAVHPSGIWLWDLASGASRQLEGGNERPTVALCFAAGQRLVAAGGDICIWDAATGAGLKRIALTKPAVTLAPSRDGARLLVGMSKWPFAVVDAASGATLSLYAPWNDTRLRVETVWSLDANPAWLPDERYVAVALTAWDERNALALVDLETRAVVQRMDARASAAHLTVSPDGRLAATTSTGRGLCVWMLPGP